ncbi:MAG: hypothetical protein RMJ33_02020 [Saprospiraceae bacterium]|nr:hypothetical protein [Saprospiraceae bacterium]MDW8228590.1 hypothetical protein [Saprospiraceae bacterium]
MLGNTSAVYRIPERDPLHSARGGFLKRILVIAMLERGETVNTAFLEKILAATGMDLHKDTLFAAIQPDEYTGLSAFLKDKQPQAVLVFGATPAQLGFQAEFPRYEPVKFYEAKFLWADSLAALEPDKALKGRLWAALQAMFLS